MSAGAGPQVLVRPFRIDEWRLFRALRLAALAESPGAFASTSEREAAFDDGTWQDRVAASEAKVSFLAELAGEPVGVAHGQLDATRASQAWLMAMWVSPTRRGVGVGAALVEAVSSWASARGATRLALQVTEGNRAAEALYASRGFRPTGASEPLRPGSTQRVATLERSLR